jgi:hypothetical protein
VTCSSRARIEFTFQLAIFKIASYTAASILIAGSKSEHQRQVVALSGAAYGEKY